MKMNCLKSGAVLTICGLFVTPALAADSFKVDTGHSNVIFRVKHLNVSYFYAMFNEIGGSFIIDESDPANSSIDVEIKADSVHTKMDKLTAHLKSADFFSVAEFPTISFKSTKIAAGDEGKLKVTGNLTLHGVTKEITVDVEKTGEGEGMPGETRAGLETVFTIQRSDYGMDFMTGKLGDEVRVIVSLEGARR